MCFLCFSAVVSADSMREGVFVKGGFGNWRQAREKLWEYGKSSFHLEVVSKQAVSIKTKVYRGTALTGRC